MNDYISREAVLSKCDALWTNADETTQTGVDTINAVDKITDFIESLPAADVQPVNQWISVKDRLPEVNTMVIVACYGSGIVIPKDKETVEECCKRFQRECVRVTLGFIGSDGWYDSDCSAMIISPLYWQPLPEPPKDGDTE